jgi:lysophospholipase L1-like esterase
MFRNLVCITLLAGAFTPAVHAQEAKDFFFQKNDRIVFLGDSITEQYQYSSYMELYLTTRFPQWNLTFINAGISGDTAGGGANRFQSHVLDEKPTAVTINFGMNDGGYGAFNPQSSKNFANNTKKMLDLAKKANVRVAVVSPNAVDHRVNPKFKLYLETQKQFYAPLKEVAKDAGMTFVDQYATTRAALERMEKDDPETKKVRPFGDGFHTSSPGGLLMAHAILTGLKAPAVVSDVVIHSVGPTTGEVKGCKVNFTRKGGGIFFNRLDEALPLPIQKDWLSVLPYMNDLKDFNWYGLTVKGLEGKHTLSIDGKAIGTYTADELAKGINVGNVMTGPIYEQGQKVLQAINVKNAFNAARFGVVRFNAPDWLADAAKERRPAELAKRSERIQEMQANIYKLAQPTPHQWELTPAK